MRLTSDTGYPIESILAVAWNMRNNKLWTSADYNSSRWLSPTGVLDETEFWDEIDAGLGILWYEGAESPASGPADKVYRRTVEGSSSLRATA